MGTEKRGRGRPRREGADEEILAIARAMLRDGRDAGALTVDAVAERAGVAKTTVYRRWPSKRALIAAAIEPLIASRKDEVDAVLAAIAERRQELIALVEEAWLADALIDITVSS
ncbi:MAG TPA: helix-turn-helix domain-containing protein [Thermoanaerobaculia bacterium]|nr:helix-turn-helix domain-containing protein [Thermoanaerobaculia bacterium]